MPTSRLAPRRGAAPPEQLGRKPAEPLAMAGRRASARRVTNGTGGPHEPGASRGRRGGKDMRDWRVDVRESGWAEGSALGRGGGFFAEVQLLELLQVVGGER